MRIEIGSCTSVEGHARGCLELLPATVLTPSFDRVNPVEAHPAALGCAFACLCQWDRVDGTQAHLASPAVEGEPEDPRLGPTGTHLEVKPPSIVEHPFFI